MKWLLPIIFSTFLIVACNSEPEISSINPVNWQKRTVDLSQKSSLQSGETYLSVYSEIYSDTEHRTHDLTVTVSMRNMNRSDTIFIKKAEYFNTEGHLIRTYFDAPIYLSPMETVEIVINEKDKAGGTGANFMFEWQKSTESDEPFFEAIMISTSGSQGLSFTTYGKNKLFD